MLVEVLQPEPKGLESLALLVRPLISPLTTTGLIILFLLFMLLGREDLRDRVVRLAGKSDLPRTTMALDDAGTRLSGYFLMQAAVNASFGFVIGIGLAAIGIPHAALWGIMSGLMRYVPFLGTLISATFPTLLAAAVDPGWSSVIATVSLYVLCELIARQILEPRLYGPRTGLSPIATVVASLLWTLLWGPIGLLLATPLTVCLVVFGRHINALNFIEVLLGDVPALKPEERFYQRLLAGDVAEATDMAENIEGDASIVDFYDRIAMRALALAEDDILEGKLSHETQRELLETVSEFVDDVDDLPEPAETNEETSSADESAHEGQLSLPRFKADWHVDPQIICTGGLGVADFAGALFLTHVLQGRNFKVSEKRALALTRENSGDARLVCVVHFEIGYNAPRVANLVRRLRRRLPQSKILVCLWATRADRKTLEDRRQELRCDFIVASFAEVISLCEQQSVAEPAGAES
jgi:hypothetical protein